MVDKSVPLLVLTAVVLLQCRSEAATSPAVKICGRQLSEIMSRICQTYNSPTWDVPTVVEQPGEVARLRRRRHVGIADQCCQIGCTWEQFSEYCSISTYTEPPPAEKMEAHIIEGRSAERVSERAHTRQVGRRRARGRCWCRRRRRAGRRRPALMGNMEKESVTSTTSAPRAAPVVGTVSPLITWGRIFSTDVVTSDGDHYAYVVYSNK